jgi:hypothetical protein
MRSYPWYEINGLTGELEPYAVYVASRLQFERCYQPEPDRPISVNRVLDVEALRDSFEGDEERYSWISGDPIMREIVHMLWCKPAELIRFAKINAEYMAGFRKSSYRVQAQIHMMAACLITGSASIPSPPSIYEDEAISKKLLRNYTMILWAHTRLHNEWFFARPRDDKLFSPTAAKLKTTLKTLPPSTSKKFHWPEVYTGLGLSDLPQFGKQTYKPGPGIFSWMMGSDPENHQDVSGLFDALDCIDDEHTK